jgi:hypothetical protein
LFAALTPIFLDLYIEDPSIQEVLAERLDQVDAILRDTDELIKDYRREEWDRAVNVEREILERGGEVE